MSPLRSVWSNELRLFWRSRWLPIALAILPVASVVYQFILVQGYHEHPTGWLSLSAHISLVGMLMFMLLGLSTAWQEQRAACDDVMGALPGSVMRQTGSKALALLTVWGIVSAVSTLILFPMVCIKGTPLPVYGEACLFLLMYWFLPWLICAAIGLLVGLLVHSRLAYPLILLLWLMTSPINMGFFRIVMTALGGNVDLRRMAYLLNLSIVDIHQSYNAAYGFPLEASRWASRFLLVAVVSLLLFAVASLRSRAIYRRATAFVTTVVLALGIPSAIVAARPAQILREYHDPLAAESYDRTYYAENSEWPVIASASIPRVQTYDIALDTRRGQLKATVTMTVLFSENTDEAWFTLYRDLTIDKVEVDGVAADNYTQTGDYVCIPVAGSSQNENRITLHYAGVMSPLMYANDQAVILPAFFPWYPRPGVNAVMLINQSTTSAQLLSQPENTADFQVTFSGPQPAFSNLSANGPNTFTGRTASVTLMAGTMEAITVDGATVVYPRANYPFPQHFSAMIRQLQEQSKALSPLFPDSRLHTDTLFLVSCDWPVISNNLLWTMTDHTILSVSSLDWEGQFLENGDWRGDMAAAWTRDLLKSGEEIPVYNLYQYALSDYLSMCDGSYEIETASLTGVREQIAYNNYDDSGKPLPEERWNATDRQTYRIAGSLQTFLESHAGQPAAGKLFGEIYRAFSEKSVSIDTLQACIDHASEEGYPCPN